MRLLVITLLVAVATCDSDWNWLFVWLFAFSNNPCSNVDCSGHGTCSNGACVCDWGYAGTNCQTDEIAELQQQVADLKQLVADKNATIPVSQFPEYTATTAPGLVGTCQSCPDWWKTGGSTIGPNTIYQMEEFVSTAGGIKWRMSTTDTAFCTVSTPRTKAPGEARTDLPICRECLPPLVEDQYGIQAGRANGIDWYFPRLNPYSQWPNPKCPGLSQVQPEFWGDGIALAKLVNGVLVKPEAGDRFYCGAKPSTLFWKECTIIEGI